MTQLIKKAFSYQTSRSLKFDTSTTTTIIITKLLFGRVRATNDRINITQRKDAAQDRPESRRPVLASRTKSEASKTISYCGTAVQLVR